MRHAEPGPPLPPGTVTIELFGVARLLAKIKSRTLALPPEARLQQVLSALIHDLPVLAGPVVNPATGALAPGHTCNVNGMAFVRDPDARIHPGDTIYILSADAGG